MPPIASSSQPISVLVNLATTLEREAFVSRINECPGYLAIDRAHEVAHREGPHSRPQLIGGAEVAQPDVCLTDRCGSSHLRTPPMPIVVVGRANHASGGDCVCCRNVSREASWSDLLAALALASGRSPALVGPKQDELANLTRRERDVLKLVGRGKSVPESAAELGVAVSTVGNHKYRLMRKLGATTSLQLLRIAVRNGLADFD